MKSGPVETWHRIVENRDVQGLDALLADEAVFHSPVVHTPQVGKAITKKYLAAAFQVFFNESFRYVRELQGDRDAVLEFELMLEGITVNGIDMIKWNEAGKIIEFKVMLRPLKAVNLIHQKMAEMLRLRRGPSRVNQMLVHCFARRALIRVVGGLQAANLAALLIVDVVNVQRVLSCGRVGNTEELGGPVISLYRLTFGERLVEFTAYVHAFVCEQIQAIEFFVRRPPRMAQVSHQSAAPGLLNDYYAGLRIGVTGCEHFRVEHRVEQGVAVDPGTMLIGQLGRLYGQ